MILQVFYLRIKIILSWFVNCVCFVWPHAQALNFFKIKINCCQRDTRELIKLAGASRVARFFMLFHRFLLIQSMTLRYLYVPHDKGRTARYGGVGGGICMEQSISAICCGLYGTVVAHFFLRMIVGVATPLNTATCALAIAKNIPEYFTFISGLKKTCNFVWFF